ncbi:MAG: hypothetical protein R3223_12760, partial [Longimicrobiales bacterium]|nr:hypothetical protein [Longimicrobiales bacterium]
VAAAGEEGCEECRNECGGEADENARAGTEREVLPERTDTRTPGWIVPGHGLRPLEGCAWRACGRSS